jgi:glutamyl-tRNA reductase
MMLFAAGASHKTAPLAVRERLALPDSKLVAVAPTLKPHLDLAELVLLSSCNRVEIYGTTRRAITDGKSVSRLLCSETEDLTRTFVSKETLPPRVIYLV